MHRGDGSRNLHQNREEGGGVGGQHSDEGADGGVPQYHGTPMCPRLGEGEILFRTNISKYPLYVDIST